jgi:single-strand DNA-binding protein
VESPFIERRSGVVRKERGQEREEHIMSNATTICGHLTREPEIRYTKEGQATTQLGVAVNRRWQDKGSGEWQEATSFFDVVCWRDLAENVALSLSKGMRVVVTGRLEQRSWETDEGEHRSKVEIVAEEIGPSLHVRRTMRSVQGEQESEGSDDTEVPSV